MHAAPPTAIVAALHEELHTLLPRLDERRELTLGGRRFHLGRLHGVPLVLVLSGIGKVAAAATAAVLLQHFAAARVVFTGVAGALAEGVRVGDVVVARELLQHDLDVSPLFPRYVVPGSGRARFAADPALGTALAAAARRCLADAPLRIGRAHLAAFGIQAPAVHEGLVVSGDRFVSTAAESAALRQRLPEALAVEMEGAALAQVCADFGVPCAVLRTVSDRADDAAHVDFGAFIAEVASVYAGTVLTDWLAAEAGRG